MPASRVVVLGTGFGAFNLVKRLSNAYAITVISPRNHFLFTPLLPGTTVGTLEFRSIIEPIRHARRGLTFYHAAAVGLDSARRLVMCRGVAEGDPFTVPYDLLVIAVGAVSNTFQVPGVEGNALYLRELSDARALRQRIIGCFERANLPDLRAGERERLLHFVVCGGGPTGVEFAAELHDFMAEDLATIYPQLVDQARITLVEATHEILSTFDRRLRKYAMDLFRRQRIRVLTGSLVVRVEPDAVTLDDGSVLRYGLLLWSTGNGPTAFAHTTALPRDRLERFLIDDYFQVQGTDSIYALGDCSVVAQKPLPATSQVAQQQGKYLADAFNRRAASLPVRPFRYRHWGMLAYVGMDRALADLEPVKGRGWATWLFWRSAYLSRIVSVKNKVLVLFDWCKAKIFGRDTSQF
jgi:NADH:ubiquinone reductase (non-electrogenic)